MAISSNNDPKVKGHTQCLRTFGYRVWVTLILLSLWPPYYSGDLSDHVKNVMLAKVQLMMGPPSLQTHLMVIYPFPEYIIRFDVFGI